MTTTALPLPTHRFAKPAGYVLLVYWVCLFLGTHRPKDSGVDFSMSDKILHFGAYFGLALLLALAWSLRRPLTIRSYAVMSLLLMAYGAMDELLQIPVGRHCDPLDWLADTGGVIAGLTLFWLARKLGGLRGRCA
jgi:VanZ family protein